MKSDKDFDEKKAYESWDNTMKGLYFFCSIILYLKIPKKRKKSKEKDWQEKEECCIIYERQKARTGLWKLNRKRQFQISEDISENKKKKRWSAWAKSNGEFDPGSGWTLAACLIHASRTKTVESLLLTDLVANGWVTRREPAHVPGITDGNVC